MASPNVPSSEVHAWLTIVNETLDSVQVWMDINFLRTLYYLPTLPLGQDMTQGLNSEFSFS